MRHTHEVIMKFMIEKGIPFKKRLKAYNFEDMQVGDSFEYGIDEINRIRNAAVRYKKEHPDWNYSSHRVDDKHYRLWRIKPKEQK